MHWRDVHTGAGTTYGWCWRHRHSWHWRDALHRWHWQPLRGWSKRYRQVPARSFQNWRWHHVHDRSWLHRHGSTGAMYSATGAGTACTAGAGANCSLSEREHLHIRLDLRVIETTSRDILRCTCHGEGRKGNRGMSSVVRLCVPMPITDTFPS